MGKTILFVSSKPEAREALKAGAQKLGQPFVAGRWIGGTLTNFGQIRSRIDKMLDLMSKREKGELSKYTKKERLLIDRDIIKLDELFAGLVPLIAMPAALVVIDPGKEHTAISEAKRMGIPVVALANSDCDLKGVEYAVPANDATRKSVGFFMERMVAAYEAGKAPQGTETR